MGLRGAIFSVVLFSCYVLIEGQGIFPFRPIDFSRRSCRTPGAKCVSPRECSTQLKLGSFPQICSFSPYRICCADKVVKENKTGSLVNLEVPPPPNVDRDCGIKGSVPIRFGDSLFIPPPAFISRRRKRASVRELFKDFNPGNDEVAVVGGRISYKHSWPWMALLGRKRGPSNLFFCGGALINKQFVLTAAHCVLEDEPFFVRLGEHGIKGADTLTIHEDVPMADVLFHPTYKLDKGYYDMALIKLARPVTFRKEIKPICLPWGKTGAEDLVGEKVTVTGWGAETFGGALSPFLQEVDVEVFEPSKCQTSYATLPDFRESFPDGMSKTNIVCAGDLLGGKDSCQGDSGGPMVHAGTNSRYTLAGIISKGYGCGKAGFPGLYAPLRHYETLKWIKSKAF